ncbi:HNH endonuclease [Kocuria soli]|uniref:HNH endonuclease n=1 Tax=Kocuria soli TaxID=2485125 RepID=A0A3N3ZVX9_9MICC|nr:HNH endonuclease [Kocuria soli]
MERAGQRGFLSLVQHQSTVGFSDGGESLSAHSPLPYSVLSSSQPSDVLPPRSLPSRYPVPTFVELGPCALAPLNHTTPEWSAPQGVEALPAWDGAEDYEPDPSWPEDPAPCSELIHIDGEPAAHLVDDLREASRTEAASRGRVLRRVAELYAYALARRGDTEHAWIHELTRTKGPRAQVGPVASVATALAQSSTDLVLRDVAAEVGVALMLPSGTARATVEEALVLAGDLPETLEALEEGRITWAHARLLLRTWRALLDGVGTEDSATAAQIETATTQDELPPVTSPAEARREAQELVQELLTRAPHTSVAQLGDHARRRRAKLGSAAHRRACASARRHRNVWVTPADDGLAYLNAVLDASVATAIKTRLDTMARTLDDDHRLVGEKRADVLGDLLLDGELPEGSGIPRGIRGQVSITVPAADLVAHDPDLFGVATRVQVEESGAHLQGYGPISPGDPLRIAAASSSWKRLLTHPDTGVVIEHGRATYTVPAGLRRLLAERDHTCRFPGCRRRATGCDVDHTVAWEDGGSTDAENLAHLCRHHHRIKHDDGALGAWRVQHLGHGVLEWRSPTGVVRRTVPGAATSATTEWLAGGTAATGPPLLRAGAAPDDPPPF